MKRTQLLAWLKKHRGSDRHAVRTFTYGGFIFATGVMLILLVNQLLADSILQELCALLGLFIMTLGGAFALWGYLRISLFKVIIFVLEDKT